MTAHAPQRLPFLFFAKHRLDIVQVLAICRFSPFNGRVAPFLLRANAGRHVMAGDNSKLQQPVSEVSWGFVESQARGISSLFLTTTAQL
jgi:hypothetical protein